MKVCFETFGCRLNKAEALQMEAEYLAKGWKLTENHSEANLFIVRGCSVTARAQRECEQLVERLKRHHPGVPVRVCGCLTTKSKAGHREETIWNRPPAPNAESPIPTRTARAYLKVQDGCAGLCAFCIVPQFRGESKSIGFTDLLDRSKRFIDAGYHEIVVTGCNLALYCSGGRRLPDLLAALAELSADCRIRLGSLEPGTLAEDAVYAMAAHDNICRFLHLPVQSGSDRILTDMKRPYRTKDVQKIADLANELMPGLGLGCDLMAGFPGETEIDFRKTENLLREIPFNNAHVFPYSERPGTVAAALPGKISRSTRSRRAHVLAHLVKESRKKYATSFIGKTVEVVIEDEKNGQGWTGQYLPCKIVGKTIRKSLVRVFIARTDGDKLFGRLDSPLRQQQSAPKDPARP